MSATPPPAGFRSWRTILLVTFLAVPLANYLPFLFTDGSGRFADDAVTRVDAAGYAFSIWGLIFLGMVAFALAQFRVERPTPALVGAYRFLTLAGLASIAFVPISLADDQLLGALDLYWHLGALVGAAISLRAHVRATGRPPYAWTYAAPSLYLGWISAATVIATALGLNALGVSFAPRVAVGIAVALYAVLTGLGLYLTTSAQDGPYGLTVAWALVAVGVEQGDVGLLRAVAWGGAAVVAVAALWYWVGQPRRGFYATAAGDVTAPRAGSGTG